MLRFGGAWVKLHGPQGMNCCPQIQHVLAALCTALVAWSFPGSMVYSSRIVDRTWTGLQVSVTHFVLTGLIITVIPGTCIQYVPEGHVIPAIVRPITPPLLTNRQAIGCQG